LSDGGVKRGYLGVGARPVRLPEAVRDEAGQKRAALVVAVEDGSAAEKSGLLLGDVLLRIDGEKITGPRSLSSVLRDRPEREVEAEVLRAGALSTLKLTTGSRL
jgi:S1-C subfamily serine protease